VRHEALNNSMGLLDNIFGGGSEISPSSVVGGLGGLLKQFQDAGFGDIAKSWIGIGPNEPAAPIGTSHGEPVAGAPPGRR